MTANSSRYAAAKRIVDNSQYEEVEGVLLDAFTASALVAVYEALAPAGQAKFDDMPLQRLAAFCLSKVRAA